MHPEPVEGLPPSPPLPYFEGVGSRPLKRDHYSIPLYPEPTQDRTFQAIYPFANGWRKEALQAFKNRADQDAAYHLPGEVTRVLSQTLVYLPLYIIQRRPGPPEDLPLFLAFSRIQSMRDEVLEEAINQEPLIQVPLHQANQNDLEEAVKQALNQRGLEREAWYLQTRGLGDLRL